MGQAGRVWVFNGAKASFSSGISTDLDRAERWIEEHGLTGTVTAYPLNTGVYEWAIAEGIFRPSKPHEASPEFIGRFTSASMEQNLWNSVPSPRPVEMVRACFFLFLKPVSVDVGPALATQVQ